MYRARVMRAASTDTVVFTHIVDETGAARLLQCVAVYCSTLQYLRRRKISAGRNSSARIGTHMGWLRLVGSLKTYVSFAKEPFERDDILQKRRVFLRSLLITATPIPR